jgi:hypothetical protein
MVVPPVSQAIRHEPPHFVEDHSNRVDAPEGGVTLQ